MSGDVVQKGRVGGRSRYTLSHKGASLDAVGGFQIWCSGLLVNACKVWYELLLFSMLYISAHIGEKSVD